MRLIRIAAIPAWPADWQSVDKARLREELPADVQLADWEEDILIVEGQAQAEALRLALARLNLPCELLPAIRMPERVRLRRNWDDYGFTGSSGGVYFFADSVLLFSVAADGAGSEAGLALMQMEEHLLAAYEHQGGERYVCDRQFAELMEGIARAYGCMVNLHAPDA